MENNKNICRICLKSNEMMWSMFSEEIVDLNLPKKLSDLTLVTISENDGLPDCLCAKCAFRTEALWNFKLQVEESERKLRGMFHLPKNDLKNAGVGTLNSEEIRYYNVDDELSDEENDSNLIVKDLSSVFGNLNPLTDMNEYLDVQVTTRGDYIENFLSSPEDKDLMNLKILSPIDSDPADEMIFYTPNDIENKILDNPLELLDDKINLMESSNIQVVKIDENNSENEFGLVNLNSNLLGSLNDTIVKIKEMKMSDGTSEYQCSLCLENYRDLLASLNHTVDFHIPETGPFYCVLCEKDCNSYKDLKAHIKIHTGNNPYICFLCNKSYSLKRYLKRHMLSHTDFPRQRCFKCGNRFKTKSELESHLKIHLNGPAYSCNQCPKIFNHKSNFKHHLITTHLDPQGIRLPKYPCYVCNKRFVNNRTLETHMRVHTGEKPYKCDICNRSFSQKGNLLSHIRLHSNPRSYFCPYCGKSFNQRSTLRDHTVLHTGEKPYVCEICGIALTFNAALRRHMWSHSGDKPFGCEICNARFIGKYELNRHMKIHSDNRTKIRGRGGGGKKIGKKMLKDQEDGGDDDINQVFKC